MIMKDAETLFVWVWLLGNATFEKKRVLFGGVERELKKGELVTTTKFISNELKINESKVNRILKMLENEKQIERQTTSRNTLIYIVNWEKYQADEKQNEKQVTNERQTNDNQMKDERQTSEEQMTTIQESNNDKELQEEKESKKEKKDTCLAERKQIIEYLNQVCGTRYKHGSELSKKHINARLNEGYRIEDFFEVIDKKYAEWHETDNEKYLRPETLFGNKFEGYLNQKNNAQKGNAEKMLEQHYDMVSEWARKKKLEEGLNEC